MSQVVAGIVFTCLAISTGFELLSIARPELSTWPPPRTSPWPRPVLAIVGPLFPIAVFGQLPLGVLDWNSFVLDHWARFVAGGALLGWGGFWALWGYRTLGAYVSQGNESELIDTGAYRYCRNPQYIGSIASLAGYALVCNSSLTLIAAALTAVAFLRLPFAEEPWLRERLGVAYQAYCARVPRFLPSRSGARALPAADTKAAREAR